LVFGLGVLLVTAAVVLSFDFDCQGILPQVFSAGTAIGLGAALFLVATIVLCGGDQRG
jgi:hypothetical protein